MSVDLPKVVFGNLKITSEPLELSPKNGNTKEFMKSSSPSIIEKVRTKVKGMLEKAI